MPARLVALFLLVAVAASVAATVTPHASVEAAPLPPLVDVSVESKPFYGIQAGFHVTVTNNFHPGFSAQAVQNVQVQIEPQTLGGFIGGGVPSPGRFDVATGIWTIPSMAPGISVEATFSHHDFSRYGFDSFGYLTPIRGSATLVQVFPNETPGFELNNTTEEWYMYEGGRAVALMTYGDAGVEVAVDNRVPQAGGQVTFVVRSVNQTWIPAGIAPPLLRSNRRNDTQVGVKVAINISEGLQFAPGLHPPGGTTFDGNTMIWDVGSVSSIHTAWESLDVPVVVTPSPSFAEVPLERRCLTAEVVEAVPDFELDPRRQLNDAVTLCLGQRPVVITEGDYSLWWLHDCFDDSTYPCDVNDNLKLFVRDNDGTNNDTRYLDPESVIVHLPDRASRAYDRHADSLTGANIVTWQTRRLFNLTESAIDLRDRLAHWNDYGPFAVAAMGLTEGGVSRQVRVREAGGPSDGETWYDLDPDDTAPSFSNPSFLDPIDIFVEFDHLGTYVIRYMMSATDSEGSTHSASADYTFRVGPISELEVRDGGRSPLARADQTAYTIVAANNGPDTAPAVEVTLSGVPQGAQAIPSDGLYAEGACDGNGLCDGAWYLGQMPVSDTRAPSGQLQFPTLTLIAPSGSAAPDLTASIENREDYSVEIDGVTHSTDYFDYFDNNNSATIAARRGTGAGVPGQPQTPQARLYGSPPVAIVSWEPVERLNLFRVDHYEVNESEPPCRTPAWDAPGSVVPARDGLRGLHVDFLREGQKRCYAVRAVNVHGVKGYWSWPARAGAGESRRNVVVTEQSVTVAEDGGTARYYVGLSSQPIGAVTITCPATIPARPRWLPRQ